MDGNGRWAKKRGLPRSAGHLAGVKTVRRIVRTSSNIGIKFLTMYAFSTENWKRPKAEVSTIMSLFKIYLKKKYQPLIVEVKGFMSVGFARQRLGYDKMPTNEEMKNFIKLIEKELTPKGVLSVNGDVNTEGKETGYKLLDNHERSRAFVLGKDKGELKITKEQI